MPIIEVRGLAKIIDTGAHRVEILKGIDLDVPRGQFLAIMGPSGSGKTTLLGLLAGLDTPSAGRVILDGEDITALDEDALALVRGRKIGFVFQSYQLIPTLTAEENILLPMRRTAWAASSWLCVTSTSVVPSSRLSLSRRSSTTWPLALSRLPVGSSASRIGGRSAKARARATRCCSPPDNCTG
jgi:predicted ABC-type transport system involved in lysophospholipase L1 biosynthesis ATPase subunit